MKVVTYISQFLKSKGIDTVFELQGGMITHLIDQLYSDKFTIVSVHHEQSAAMAADAYARVTNKPGVALATSGPGATNLITGIGNCYFDSVAAIFITGQVNTSEQKGNRPIRQLGFQETDIVSIIKPITKKAYAVKDAKDIPNILKEAYSISMQGRQGPVLIDIPMDIQRQECEDFKDEKELALTKKPNSQLKGFIKELAHVFSQSKKPLILAGRGVRAGEATNELLELAEKHNLPVVTSLNGIDAIPYNHPNRIGFIGSYGNRWANYAMGSCDLLLVLGSRLDLRQTGVDIDSFIQGKTIYHVDIEEGELNNRFTNSKVICEDVLTFLQEFLKTDSWGVKYDSWYKEIEDKRLERRDIDELSDIKGLNPNKFIHTLSEYSKKARAVSTDVGSNQMWVAQSIELEKDQFFLTSGGMGAMGYALPAAIGASFALNREPILCIVGDGGFQINIQELQTIKRNNLPVKIVIMNNHCLGMIRQFQDSYFDSNYASTVWGYSEPDFVSIANAYGINASKIETEEQVIEGLKKLWEDPNQAYLLDVSFDIHTNVYPKMLFGNPITKMEPFY